MRRKKNIFERLQDEINHTEELNRKINAIEAKSKQKKENSRFKKRIFDFQKEFNYLNEQQSKLENEILGELYDICQYESDMNESSILKGFYDVVSMERIIECEFNKILSMAKGVFREGKYDAVNKLMEYLKVFNNNLISITDEDVGQLIDISENEVVVRDQEMMMNTTHLEAIITVDYFNILGINDVDYLILQTLREFQSLNSNILPSKLDFRTRAPRVSHDILNAFTLSFSPAKVNPGLVEKCCLILGDEESTQMILKVEKASHLAFLKHEYEYKNLFNELLNQLSTGNLLPCKTINKMLMSNINFFSKSIPNTHLPSLPQKLSIEFPYLKDKDNLVKFNQIVNFLYTFRNNKKTLFQTYIKEINEIKESSEKIITETISEAIQNIKDTAMKNEFNEMKNEIKAVHMKNKEMFDIKQKIKKEIKQKEKEMQRLENEKKEKEQKEYYQQAKIVSQNFKNEKNGKLKLQKQKFEKEYELRKIKEKEDIKTKLPLIAKRQMKSNEDFVKAYKQKELKKVEKQIEQDNLNKIIENLKVRPKVNIDPNRVKMITESLKARYECICENKMDEGERVKLFVNNGFTVDHLMKDLRFQVNTALAEAGLLNSSYANQLLSGLANLTK